MLDFLMDLVSDSKLATKKENKKKIHKLLDKYGSVEAIERSGNLRDSFELDFGILSSPLNAIRIVHKILNLPPKGTIIGKDTLDKFKNFTHEDYENFLEKYKLEMINHFNKIVKNNPSKKKFLKGWINRTNRAHLAE